ncbi:MAG: hypothetical protein ABGW50_06685 [Thermococcus sp.]
MQHISALFVHLGVPLAPEKVVGPSPTLTFLGIEIDPHSHLIRLPPDKFSALTALLTAWGRRARCTKRELLSLIGHLSFAAKVVKPGRLFLRRLIDLASSVPCLHHHLHLTESARADILWWLEFLPAWNGVSLIQAPVVSSIDLHLFTDASSLGIGGVFGDRWFSLPLSSFQSVLWFPFDQVFDINFWELLALLTAVFTWLPSFRDRQVAIHTDNLALVYVWSRGSRSPLLMRLIRALFLRTAQSNTNLLLPPAPYSWL